MQTVSLTIEQSWGLAGALMGAGAVLAVVPNRHARTVGAFAREISIIGFLYGLWHYVGTLAAAGTTGASAHARTIERIERDLHLPSERWTQHLVLGHPLVVQAANLYYATMHFTGMLLFLLWLFVRHRDRYRPIRQVMAWTTLACLLVQLIPVAPPRMMPGVVDTALRYNQSVYSNGLAADQLSSMPSVHVAWAVLVGWYVWRVSPSRWRWIGPAHAVLTVLIVVVTGNHYWLDGIVAALLLAACAWGVAGIQAAWRLLRARLVRSSEPYLTLV
ncbi:phosphatase PAP2 family protein [uncultured Jatrophihabitans sp.]|uniref:phosphatase PAP2 family protein n=1 Tax=uncultured Jatrophihabitans sp. TaxID=1610747 RepID=UPI0035CAC432